MIARCGHYHSNRLGAVRPMMRLLRYGDHHSDGLLALV
jgi:hypothetical protein